MTVPALGVQEMVKVSVEIKVNTLVTGLTPKVGLRVIATSGVLRASAFTTTVITRTHTVQRGESLSSVSRMYFGTTKLWTNIRTANRSLFKQFTQFPNVIRIGWKLLIP
jgi:nucleoid-associated protein YgaU